MVEISISMQHWRVVDEVVVVVEEMWVMGGAMMHHPLWRRRQQQQQCERVRLNGRRDCRVVDLGVWAGSRALISKVVGTMMLPLSWVGSIIV